MDNTILNEVEQTNLIWGNNPSKRSTVILNPPNRDWVSEVSEVRLEWGCEEKTENGRPREEDSQ